jgi:hypothetical protein
MLTPSMVSPGGISIRVARPHMVEPHRLNPPLGSEVTVRPPFDALHPVLSGNPSLMHGIHAPLAGAPLSKEQPWKAAPRTIRSV